MGGIVPNHRLPFVADCDLQLNDKLDYPAPLGLMEMPDSGVGAQRKCVASFRQGAYARCTRCNTESLGNTSATSQFLSHRPSVSSLSFSRYPFNHRGSWGLRGRSLRELAGFENSQTSIGAPKKARQRCELLHVLTFVAARTLKHFTEMPDDPIFIRIIGWPLGRSDGFSVVCNNPLLKPASAVGVFRHDHRH